MPVTAVEIEVVLLRPLGAGLGYRTLRAPLDGAAPDRAALELAGPARTVCHSTSWRHVAPATLVLTYAVLPDPDPACAAVPLLAPAVLSSGDAVRPGPADLDGHHVAAHAVRHLALLSHQDPTIAATVARDRALWDVVRRLAATTPTGTHENLLHAVAGHPVAGSAAGCDDGPAVPAGCGGRRGTRACAAMDGPGGHDRACGPPVR